MIYNISISIVNYMLITSKNNKKILFLGLLFLLLLLVAFTYAYYLSISKEEGQSHDSSKVDSVNYDASTEAQIKAGEEIKKNSIETSGKPTKPGSDTPQFESGDLQVSITSTNQDASILRVRSLIGTVIDNGECRLNLIRGNTVITKTSGIQPLANASTCEGFDIPVDELTPGEWQIELNISANNKKGSVTGSVIIK